MVARVYDIKEMQPAGILQQLGSETLWLYNSYFLWLQHVGKKLIHLKRLDDSHRSYNKYDKWLYEYSYVKGDIHGDEPREN